MPVLITPGDMPEVAVRVIELMGSRARTAILRLLSQQPEGLSTNEVAAALGTNRISAMRHLLVLEDAGVIAADVPASERRGRQLRWTVRPSRIVELADFWRDYAQGLDVPEEI